MHVLVRKTDKWTRKYGRYRVDSNTLNYFNKINKVVDHVTEVLKRHIDEISYILVGEGIPKREANVLRALPFVHNYHVKAPLLVTPLKDIPRMSMIRVKGDIQGGMPVENELVPLFDERSNKTMPERLEEVIINAKVDVDLWGRIHPKGTYSTH